MEKSKLSVEAENDLIRIHRYGVHRYGENQADQYFYRFFNCFERISTNPYLYATVGDIRKGYRRCVCGVDNVYYRIAGDGIEIMAIVGRQDIGSKF